MVLGRGTGGPGQGGAPNILVGGAPPLKNLGHQKSNNAKLGVRIGGSKAKWPKHTVVLHPSC